MRFLIVALLLAQWPQFRGPDGNGVSSAAGLPLKWSETENVRWKTPVHGRAWSSPIVLGGQVWMTTATPDGRQLYAVAVDKATGKIVFDLKLFDVPNPQFAHAFNTYASPTPVAEPGRVPQEQAVPAFLHEHVGGAGVGHVCLIEHLPDVAPQERARERRLAHVRVGDQAQRDVDHDSSRARTRALASNTSSAGVAWP